MTKNLTSKYSDEWRRIRLGNCATFLRTLSYSRDQLTIDGEVAYLHYGDIHIGPRYRLNAKTTRMPGITHNAIGNASLLRVGDLVFVDASEDTVGIGKSVEITNVPDGGLVAGLHTIAVRFDKTVIADGFKSYLQEVPAFRKHLLRLAAGTKVLATSRSHIASAELLLPSVAEQEAIAEALRDTDELIQSLERLIAKKRAMRQGSMQQLLTGKTRLPGFSGEWELMELGEIGPMRKGRGIRKDEVQSRGIACVRYGEIYTRFDDRIQECFSFISEEVAKTSEPLDYGDIVFTVSGETSEDIGKCAAFLGNFRAYVGSDTVVLRPIGHDSSYLGYALNYGTISKQKATLGQGDAVVHLSSSNLARIAVSLPALIEQKAISQVLTDMDAEIDALVARRDKVALIKTGMMQELLTGRTRLA